MKLQIHNQICVSLKLAKIHLLSILEKPMSHLVFAETSVELQPLIKKNGSGGRQDEQKALQF